MPSRLAAIALTLTLTLAGPTFANAAPGGPSEPLVSRGHQGARLDLKLVGRRVRSSPRGSIAFVEVRAGSGGKSLGVIKLREGARVDVSAPYDDQGHTATATLRATRVTANAVVIEYLHLGETYTLN